MKLAIRLATSSLRSHRWRACLSALGVVISVFTVSLIFIVSDSLKAGLKRQVDDLSSNTTLVNGATPANRFNLTLTAPEATLDNDDLTAINHIAQNAQVNGNLILSGNLSFDGRQLNTTTIATNLSSPQQLGTDLGDGSWFDDEVADPSDIIDDGANKKWVVLGVDLANQLLGTNHPQNQIVDIKGEKFTVVGVLKKIHQPLSIFGYDINHAAFISLANGQKLAGNNKLSQIIVTGTSNTAEMRRQIASSLSRRHDDDSDYSITTSDNVASQLTWMIDTLTVVACVVAGIILLVSLISITNVILVNVTERRREIGIRKAVGATTRNIMGQFLAESLIMSLWGGVIGLLLAYGVAAIGLLFLGLPITFSWLALGVGFAIPVLIGLVAGLYPAYRASRQNIIEALNQLT